MTKGPDADKRHARKAEMAVAFDPVAAALRQMHDRVAQEDIPDDFLRLLDEIDNRTAKGAGK